MRWMKIVMWMNVVAAVYTFWAMSFLPPHNPLSIIHLVQFGVIPLYWFAASLMAKAIKMRKETDAMLERLNATLRS